MYANFEFYAPTRVVFGKGAEESTGKLLREQGVRKALIHYGGKSALASGLPHRTGARSGKHSVRVAGRRSAQPAPLAGLSGRRALPQ